MKRKEQSTLSTADAQNGFQLRKNMIRRRWFALSLGAFLFTSVCSLLPSPVEAGCQRWDVSGQWELRLDNGENVKVNLQQGKWGQTSANLTGTGERIATAGANSYFDKPQKGVISGNITDNAFTMLLTVRTDQHRFTGTIGPSGKMEGICTTTTSSDRHWVSSRRMKCADEAPAPTRKVPFIVAGNNPGQAPGTKTLTWDGGPEHPYAEVWVKVNDQDEKFVVEKGKGTREVTVQPGNTYLYILSDSGERLDTVTVK